MRKVCLICIGFLFALFCTAALAHADSCHSKDEKEKAKSAVTEEAKKEASKKTEEGKKVVAEKANQEKAKAKVEEEEEEFLYEGC